MKENLIEKIEMPTYLSEEYSTEHYKFQEYKDEFIAEAEKMDGFWDVLESYANQEDSKLNIKDVEKAKRKFLPDLRSTRQIPPMVLNGIGYNLISKKPEREADIKLMRAKYMSAFPLFQRVIIDQVTDIDPATVSDELKQDYEIAMEKINLYHE